jgi:hypothetical protein
VKLSPAQRRIAAILGPLDGREIPGGCDRCDAVQTVAAVVAGVWQVTIHHDPDCPALLQHEGRAS